MNKPIKNIIFDLGNVLIAIDPELTLAHFRELGVADFDRLYTLIRQADLFNRLETGKITVPAFREAIRRHAGLPLTDRQIDDAWCAMLLDFPDENITLLCRLRNRYRLFLFSNTNRIHIDYYLNRLEREKGSPLLPDLFDHTFYSHEIGFRKPDREAFRYVLEYAGLKPAETLFIDDLEHNVTGARSVGIQACRFTKNDRLTDWFV
ncbi:MAG: HAD family phosphatase [Bacteroidales bacterium]|nr:HAD family phosphatase [Bacteroidales bacterium]